MNTNMDKIREYLKRCDAEIVNPALEAGLDLEFYYSYLQEMCRAVSTNYAMRVNYQTMMSRVLSDIIKAYRGNIDMKWVTNIGAHMGLQLEVIENMMNFAYQNAEPALRDVICAQADFMRLVLQRQHYVFDTIVFYAQSNWLLKQTKPSSEVADLMVKNHDLMDNIERLFAEVR